MNHLIWLVRDTSHRPPFEDDPLPDHRGMQWWHVILGVAITALIVALFVF